MGYRAVEVMAGNQPAMVQVRVSLWTWGFKSPLAHFTASPAYEARYRRIDGAPPTGVGGVSLGRDTMRVVTPCLGGSGRVPAVRLEPPGQIAGGAPTRIRLRGRSPDASTSCMGVSR
jgi:hypothetical protein